MVRLYNEERQELALQGLRRCVDCHEVKDLNVDFYSAVKGSNGKTSHCKACNAARSRTWYRSNDGIQGALDNGYKRAGVHGRRRRRVKADRLLKVWKKQGIDPMTCFYTGIQLTREPGQPNTRNLDHVEPLAVKGTAGHVSTNIVPCSASFNRYKQNKVAVYAYLTAPEQHPPIQCYVGLADGMARVDGLGAPAVPAVTRWSPSENQGEPVPMKFCDYLRMFHQDSVGTAVDSIQNDALESPVSA